MKFHFDNNSPYVLAKRVIFKLKKFADIITDPVKDVSIEQISIAMDLNPDAKQKFFVYYGNAGMLLKTNNPKPLDEIVVIQKRDIVAYVEPSEDEIVKDKVYLCEVKDPEGEWLHA
ncbi:MAG TPA: hypothetical protein PL124_09640 [Candidatus Cloacimonadota bacterium]|nr:hypothetical protein [Candidatus Cloacimonadota bacterium]HPS39661.1 hypothetical protein [Candidatus Cloacimonadota bacterium]